MSADPILPPGAITQNLDVVQLLLAAFALFFAGLVIYLRREDKREGYPLVSRIARRAPIIGWPSPPPPKIYRLMDGGTAQMPHHYPQEPLIDPTPVRNGAPLMPADPLLSGLGAGAYAMSSETPMRTLDGQPLLMPLRNTSEWSVRWGDADPRGMRVLGSDFRAVGKVTDIWVDRAAKILRYFEVARDGETETFLLPIFHCDVNRYERDIRVLVLKPDQFVHVPRLATPDIMTPREEDRITAFYAGATLYSEPN